jgi:hypothetical protein
VFMCNSSGDISWEKLSQSSLVPGDPGEVLLVGDVDCCLEVPGDTDLDRDLSRSMAVVCLVFGGEGLTGGGGGGGDCCGCCGGGAGFGR